MSGQKTFLYFDPCKSSDIILFMKEKGSIIIAFLISGRKRVCMRILIFRFIDQRDWKSFIKDGLKHAYKKNRVTATGLKPTTTCSHLNFRFRACFEQGVS